MTTVAILPIKSFSAAKQRLQEGLASGPRRALAEAMFSDVLVALRRTTGIDDVLVVTADRGAQRIAGGHGAMVIDVEERGHNVAAAAGIRETLEAGAARALLVPGDCPAADPRELDELIMRRVQPRSVLIVPDRHGTGTNALLMTPPNAITPAFGPGSCERHAASAQARGIAHQILEVPSLGLDIDTSEDLAALQERFAATHGGAAHTRGMLSQLMRSRL